MFKKKDDIPVWAIDVVKALLQSLKLKDPFTFYHCCRVGRASRLLARDMGLNKQEQNILEFSGLLHDIGKIGVADNILLKPGRLTDEEMGQMKSHADMSCEIIEPLLNIPFFKLLIPGIRYHHEKWDGRGYPYNLEGEDIPIEARIIAVVDTVDAMTNTRPYRNALTLDAAKKELVKFSDTQFDKAIAKTYLEALKIRNDDHTKKEDNEIIITSILDISKIKKAA